MGICGYQNHAQENEAENMFSYILETFKLREYSLKQAEELFYASRNLTTSKLETYEEENYTYSSKDYKQAKDKLYSKDSNFAKFHRKLAPTFDELFIGKIKDAPEYNFFGFSLGFIKDDSNKDKALGIYNLFISMELDVTIDTVVEFFEYYFEENLVNVTERMNRVLQELDENTIINGAHVVDKDLKECGNEVVEFMKLAEIRNELCVDVRKYLVDTVKNRERVNISEIQRMQKEFKYLFTSSELRAFVWDRFHEKIVQIRAKAIIEGRTNLHNQS